MIIIHRTVIDVVIGTVIVLTYQVDTNAGVKRDITEMELNHANSPMNASKALTTATERGLPVSTQTRASAANVTMVLKATGVHAMIKTNVIVESMIVKMTELGVRTPKVPSSAFAQQVSLEMEKIARISTSVQQALINVCSTQYVLIILVLTAAAVN